MKKILSAFMLIVLLCGCGKAEGYASAQDKLINMQSYRSNVEINYISSNETAVYKAVQTASSDGRYKMVTYYPDNFKDNAILFDGKMIWHYNPNVEEKISVSSQDKPEREQLILFSFIENYVKSQNTTVTTAKSDGARYTVLEAEIEGAGKFITSEKLWINNETALPERLVISDSDGKERITAAFSDFEYNCELAENEFVPQR